MWECGFSIQRATHSFHNTQDIVIHYVTNIVTNSNVLAYMYVLEREHSVQLAVQRVEMQHRLTSSRLYG